MSTLGRIRRKILDGDYFVTAHMSEVSMPNDGLVTEDVENAILKGWVASKMTGDPAGTRYMVRGPALDGTEIEVVCRFSSGDLVLITVYLVEEE